MKNIFIIILSLIVLIGSFSPSFSLVGCNNGGGSQNYALQGASEIGSSNNCNGLIGGTGSVVSKIVNILTIVAGIIIVFLLIFSGFRFIVSGGDSNRIATARKTLIGAIVGLIIITLAQLIVHFVINTAGK